MPEESFKLCDVLMVFQKIFSMTKYELRHEKTGLPSDTNCTATEEVIGSKFQILNEELLSYCRENKGADQLGHYHAAEMHLFLHDLHMQKKKFSWHCSYLYTTFRSLCNSKQTLVTVKENQFLL